MNNTGADSKWIFISGAAGDLGKAFALECARRGWNLFLTDLSEPALTRIAAGLHRGYGVAAVYRAADLTDPQSRSDMLRSVQESGTRFTSLINVAGMDVEGRFAEQRVEQIETIVRLNVEATLAVTHAVLPLRAANQPFHIINVVSMAAFYPMPIKATYAASKRFLLDFSLALDEELREENVHVTALCPAGMPTRQECVDAIAAQGLVGQLTTLDVGRVAYQTIEGALKGRRVVIPGVLNRLMMQAGRWIPRQVLARLIYQRWGKVRQQRRLAGTL